MEPVNLSDCLVCPYIAEAGTLKKRLIVCCDGTGCAADKGEDNNATNITRLSRMIANVGHDDKGEKVSQIVYYQAGLGTGAMTSANKTWQGATGDGFNEKVCEAYTFLANNYGPGDEIFLFGFSRGAYTARSLGGFLCQVGLLTPSMMDYFDEIFAAYKSRKQGQSFADTAWANKKAVPGELGLDTEYKGNMTRLEYVRQWAHLHVGIKVVGVFDTVGSLGVSGWVDQPGADTTYFSTNLHPKIEHAFHALSLDESRGNFPPTLWYRDQACKDANVVLKQCWFPGYHSDVGGHSTPSSKTNTVDEVALAWMIDQLDGLLQISAPALKYPILDRLDEKKKKPNHHTSKPPKNPEEVMERLIQWSDGTLKETNSASWWVTSAIATRRTSYAREPGQYRAIAGGGTVDYRDFNETIHPMVYHRKLISEKSHPVKYQAGKFGREGWKYWKREPVLGGRGFEWVNKVPGKAVVRVPEYVIPVIQSAKTMGLHHWTGSLERMMAPKEYLRELDQGNGLSGGGSHL